MFVAWSAGQSICLGHQEQPHFRPSFKDKEETVCVEGGGGVFWARGQLVQRPWGGSDHGTFENGKQTSVAGGWETRRRVVGDGGGESGSRGRYCWNFLLSVRVGIGVKSSGGVLSFYEATYLKPLGSSWLAVMGLGVTCKVGGGIRMMWKENITTFTDYKYPIWSFLKVMDKQTRKNMAGNHK